MPGNGPNNCNARCSKLEDNMCTAKNETTFDLGADNLGLTIGSNNASINPAYYDFAKGNSSRIFCKILTTNYHYFSLCALLFQ